MVTELQLSGISDDVVLAGVSWDQSLISLQQRSRKTWTKIFAVIATKQSLYFSCGNRKNGRSAVAGCLADALLRIWKKRIAEKLLGKLVYLVR